MKTVWIAAAVAVAVSGFVHLLASPPRSQVEYINDQDEWLFALQARIAELEGRERHVLLEASGAPPAVQSDERLAALSKRLDALESEPRETPTPTPTVSDAERERLHRRKVEARRDAIRRLPKEQRARAFYDLAMNERGRRSHEMEETILRELIEDAGPDDVLAKEAAYQIGWARASRGDHKGARQAWAEAAAYFEPQAVRRDFARFYAASSAVQMKQPDVALRELEDLIRELESEASDHPQKKSLLVRSRVLLESLTG